MILTVGSRWKSAVSETEVVVVRQVDGDHRLACGGPDMGPLGTQATGSTVDPSLAGPTLLGKRYEDEASGLELLCTKRGEGALTFDGAVLTVKGAKPLPASD